MKLFVRNMRAKLNRARLLTTDFSEHNEETQLIVAISAVKGILEKVNNYKPYTKGIEVSEKASKILLEKENAMTTYSGVMLSRNEVFSYDKSLTSQQVSKIWEEYRIRFKQDNRELYKKSATPAVVLDCELLIVDANNALEKFQARLQEIVNNRNLKITRREQTQEQATETKMPETKKPAVKDTKALKQTLAELRARKNMAIGDLYEICQMIDEEQLSKGFVGNRLMVTKSECEEELEDINKKIVDVMEELAVPIEQMGK